MATRTKVVRGQPNRHPGPNGPRESGRCVLLDIDGYASVQTQL